MANQDRIQIEVKDLTDQQLKSIAHNTTSGRVSNLVQAEIERRKILPITSEQLVKVLYELPLNKETKIKVSLSNYSVPVTFIIKKTFESRAKDQITI